MCNISSDGARMIDNNSSNGSGNGNNSNNNCPLGQRNVKNFNNNNSNMRKQTENNTQRRRRRRRPEGENVQRERSFGITLRMRNVRIFLICHIAYTSHRHMPCIIIISICLKMCKSEEEAGGAVGEGVTEKCCLLMGVSEEAEKELLQSAAYFSGQLIFNGLRICEKGLPNGLKWADS